MQIYSERRAFMKKLPAILFAAAAAMVMCSCGDADISSVTMEGEKIKSAYHQNYGKSPYLQYFLRRPYGCGI